MELKRKTAIVTGGASGFGAGIVERFRDAGAQVMIADVNAAMAGELAEKLGVLSCQADMARDEDVARLVERAVAQMGHIDILVNNAGVTHLPAALEDISEEDFDHVMAVNTKSVFLSAKYTIPHMKARGQGVVLNVASTAAVSPRPGLSWYNASKGWMITATKSMAIELAGLGIRVNALNPVAGETPLLSRFMGEDTPEMRERFLASIPIGRFSTPRDIAQAACFLCSDAAAMITGVCLEVDGGRCI